MNLVFEIDRNRLVDAATGAQVSSLQFAYPDKYPLSIEVTRGNQPFVFSGNVYVTLKPASSPLSAPLALLTVPVNSSSTVSGVLDTYIQEMDDFLPAANKRAAAFEVLVVAPSATTEVSVSVNAQISRRYNSVDQPGVTVAEKSLATQAEAEAGTNNTKWMSPLRVSQAISALANPLDDTDDLSEGTTNLYFTTARAKDALADEISEIGSDITELTGKTGQLETDLTSEAQARAAGDASLSGALTTESQTRAAADTALSDRIDLLAENLDPAAIDSISEVVTAFQQADSDLGGTITALASAAQPKNLATAIEVKAVTQGAYSDGTTIPAGTPVEEVLRKMLQTRVPATYAAPTLSISANFGTQAEIGSSYSGTIVPTWQQRDAGATTLTNLTLNGTPFASTTGAPASTYSIPGRTLTAAESWQLSTFYNAGPQKLDNFGDPSGTPIPGGRADSTTLTVTPVRRIFHGASTDTAAPTTSAHIRALATSALAPANGSTYTLTLPVGTRRAVIAYPATLRALTSVKYVELGNAEVRDTFTESTIQVDGATAGQNATAYRVYTYISAIPLGAAATYTITI